jgi:hypothetical protein
MPDYLESRLKIRSLLLFLTFSPAALAAAPYPESPDPALTPGELCSVGNVRRYPEKILYCGRKVSSDAKREIIAEYDRKLGYRIGQMQRAQFKIDHYIPLCMGGSNGDKNLWPQHETVYRYTDELEQRSCQAMADGRLKQVDAVEMIKRAKANPSSAYKYIDYLKQL